MKGKDIIVEIEISVILPVFNIKKEFLNKSLNSLCKQSIHNYEIIVVNDGSTDLETIECLIDFEKRYNYITIINQENAGVSAARNIGYECSHGEYICFIDPDDWVESTYLEELLCAIKDTKSDFIMTDCICVRKGQNIENRFLLGNERDLVGIEKNQILYQLIGKKISDYYPPEIAAGVPWGKLFSREFIEKNRLSFIPGMVRMEDNIYMLYAVEYAKKIHYLPKFLYYYRKEEGSACFKYSPNIVSYFEKYYCETEKFLNVFSKERILYSALKMKTLTSFYSYFTRYFFNKENKKKMTDVKSEINSLLKKEPYCTALENIDYTILTFQEKIFIFLLKHRNYRFLRFVVNHRYKRLK